MHNEHQSESGSVLSENNKLITELLTAAGAIMNKNKEGKLSFMPNKFVIRNDCEEKVNVGDSTWYEYYTALF